MPGIEILKEQNPWWTAKEKISEDVHIRKLSEVKYRWRPDIIDSFKLNKDIIYTLRGSRQVGKTTALKLIISELLEENRKENIFYFTCNNIDDYKELSEVIRTYLGWVEKAGRKYIFVDEITFVPEWTRALKHLADIGFLENCTVILTGSNAHDLKYEVERMPGRRGEDTELDKIMFPLSFREYANLANPGIIQKFTDLKSAEKNYPLFKGDISALLDNYFLTGGFIQAVNSFAAEGGIGQDIYLQYLSWSLGDLARMGRKEIYSRQLIQQVINSMTSNVGFDTLAKKTSIQSHITAGNYLDIMESNFILKILYQLDLNKKIAAPRKTKKIYFQDMFLYWVFQGYVLGLPDYFAGGRRRLEDGLLKSRLAENLVMTHLMRLETSATWSNTVFFFRGANGKEIDFLVRDNENAFRPIEVKYGPAGLKDFPMHESIRGDRGIIVSREDFRKDNKRIIIPAGVFLLFEPVTFFQLFP